MIVLTPDGSDQTLEYCDDNKNKRDVKSEVICRFRLFYLAVAVHWKSGHCGLAVQPTTEPRFYKPDLARTGSVEDLNQQHEWMEFLVPRRGSAAHGARY
jgi:hypothetical protein